MEAVKMEMINGKTGGNVPKPPQTGKPFEKMQAAPDRLLAERLASAVTSRNIEGIKRAVAEGADVNAAKVRFSTIVNYSKHSLEVSPLAFALFHFDAKMAMAILELGGSPDCRVPYYLHGLRHQTAIESCFRMCFQGCPQWINDIPRDERVALYKYLPPEGGSFPI
jgi:hypothetical protein